MTAGLSIYDTMQFIKPDVSTLCMGQAASMGPSCWRGTKGKRLPLPNSRVMIHQPMGGFQGRRPTSPFTPRKSCRCARN